MLSDYRLDTAFDGAPSPSIDRARYWFEQYRLASKWEARLIRAIRQLSVDRARAKESV